MSYALYKAKQVERHVSCSTHVNIRLDLLQDLIAEIERLYKLHPSSIAAVKTKAEERNAP